MHSTKAELPQAKSYSSIYDLIGASEFKNISGNKRTLKHVGDVLLFQSLNEGIEKRKLASKDSELLNETSYVTSERYHALNKKSSDKSVIRSTSTFFYDLDSLAKRHSYHCVSGLSESKKNIRTNHNALIRNGFGAKSEAIVQECATQIKPKLVTSKFTKENKKKGPKTFPNVSILSSEIFLRDNEGAYTSYKPQSEDISLSERHQKFWSFAKYRTEYTNPVSEEKHSKKKDRGKRMEDPCPCQLFSYACPCTNKKSLTELAKNSKSLTVADQVTSTQQVFVEEQKCKKHNKTKKSKNAITYEDKRTSTIDIIEKKSKEVFSSESYTRMLHDSINRKQSNKICENARSNAGSRKPRQILCPNCKEMVDVMSTTDINESLKSKSSPLYRANELPATATYTYRDINDNKSKVVESRDTCNHEPQCELVPVCQILPTDNVFANPNMSNKQSPLKPNARVIRITKGCRHHPPCTVVPSCQRINVLNNNCEYIPPCLHRPRCVNLPLCAPLSKSLYYDEPLNKTDEDLATTECLNLHQNRYMPSHQQNSLENQITRVQNTCEYLSECAPRFVINSTLGCISPIPTPCQPISHTLCQHCKSEKSCQYDFIDWKQNLTSSVRESLSSDDVIFIRDVGCQFRNKNYSPKDSLIQSKTSSDSFNCLNMNVDKYCANVHTLRYEDKFTIPISGEEISVSTVTQSSTEIDTQCPTHGRCHKGDSVKNRTTGFVPKSTNAPFVAFTHNDPLTNFYFSANDNFKKKVGNNSVTFNTSTNISKTRQNLISVKSRGSFFKGKYKNMFPVKRRRKSRGNSVNKWSQV
ncbi:uncharacterized protein [Epargyreus clarus]|uniref:uncharacterized protein n=1 Tax=Epargyreus clarus TaxID=520877 RepID=UPI003C2CD2E0